QRGERDGGDPGDVELGGEGRGRGTERGGGHRAAVDGVGDDDGGRRGGSGPAGGGGRGCAGRGVLGAAREGGVARSVGNVCPGLVLGVLATERREGPRRHL